MKKYYLIIIFVSFLFFFSQPIYEFYHTSFLPIQMISPSMALGRISIFDWLDAGAKALFTSFLFIYTLRYFRG